MRGKHSPHGLNNVIPLVHWSVPSRGTFAENGRLVMGDTSSTGWTSDASLKKKGASGPVGRTNAPTGNRRSPRPVS